MHTLFNLYTSGLLSSYAWENDNKNMTLTIKIYGVRIHVYLCNSHMTCMTPVDLKKKGDKISMSIIQE